MLMFNLMYFGSLFKSASSRRCMSLACCVEDSASGQELYPTRPGSVLRWLIVTRNQFFVPSKATNLCCTIGEWLDDGELPPA